MRRERTREPISTPAEDDFGAVEGYKPTPTLKPVSGSLPTGVFVWLLSGGAKMVVAPKAGKGRATGIRCVWHDELGAPHEAVYPPALLTETEPRR